MKIRYWLLPLLTTLALLTACSPQPDNSNKEIDNSGARAVTVAKVVLHPIAGSFTGSGLLVPREEASVGSELSGYRVLDVKVEQGAEVKLGEVLITLDPGLLKAQVDQTVAKVVQAQAKAAQAGKEAQRVKDLDGTGILSDEQIGSRRSAARSADAAVKVAQAQLAELQAQQQRLKIRAPVDGIVLERNVNPGEVVSSSEALLRMARDGLIELAAEIPEGELARISVGEKAEVTLASGKKIAASVRLLAPRVDPQTKLGKIRVQLPRDPQLRAGGYARVLFTRAAEAVPAVPEKAVQYEASGPLLVVINESNHAQRVPVKTGARAGGFVAIEDGPPVGTRVALGGGSFLLSGDLVDPSTPKDGVSGSDDDSASAAKVQKAEGKSR